MNVDVVDEDESMELTLPVTEFPDESARVNVFVVMVEVSINSLKVAEMMETTVVAPSDGEVEETVGGVVSASVESTMNEVIVRVLLIFPEESVTVIVQFE